MSDIKVNTDDLRSNSSTLQKAASELAASITQISAASASLNPSKYQGQFTGKVQGDTSQVQGSINQFQNRLTELGSELSTRANAFEIANEDRSGRVLGLSITMTDFMGSSKVMSESARMRQLNTGKANSIWVLGGSILGGFMGWLTNLPPFAWFKNNGLTTTPASSTATKTSEQKFNWPCHNSSGLGTWKFGDVISSGDYAGDRHPGVDILTALGEPIYPIGPGTIVFQDTDPDGYGEYVVVRHEMKNGTILYSLYAHLDSSSVDYIKKAKIENKIIELTTSSVIGKVGMTGNTDTPHVHLEIRTEDGIQTKPFALLKKYRDTVQNDWTKYWLDPIAVIGKPN